MKKEFMLFEFSDFFLIRDLTRFEILLEYVRNG